MLDGAINLLSIGYIFTLIIRIQHCIVLFGVKN